MIDLKILQKDPQRVAEALAARRSDLDVAEFTALDARRRELLAEVETLKAGRNAKSAEVARKKRAGENADALIAELDGLGERIRELDAQSGAAVRAVEAWVLKVPNLPHESVPRGVSEAENVELRRYGAPRVFDFPIKDHADIGQEIRVADKSDLPGLDFERAARLAGARFCAAFGPFARLERALVNFFLDVHTRENGYIEVAPPLIVNRAAMTVTGQLPKFEEDLFRLENRDAFLIPTSEVPLTNLHAGETLEEKDLPRAYTAATPCFRSEAGSYGRDTRGLIRQHQFMKVEMVRFAHPDDSCNQLELMRRHAEDLLERLMLPYRTVVLCTGDMGFAAAKTYDLEVWLPGQNSYREISSCSNCGDFQARRGNIRCRPAGGGKPVFLHTLNGSGLAVGRTLVALLENGRRKDGSILLPEALRPYMGGLETIAP